MIKKIIIISDHAGFELKNELVRYLKLKAFDVNDLGPKVDAAKISYVTQGFKIGKQIAKTKDDTLGIAMCGTGIGISFAVNRIKKVRGARITSIIDAKMAKKHNNANILVFGGKITTIKKAVDMFNAFTREDYEGGRHELRLKQLDK